MALKWHFWSFYGHSTKPLERWTPFLGYADLAGSLYSFHLYSSVVIVSNFVSDKLIWYCQLVVTIAQPCRLKSFSVLFFFQGATFRWPINQLELPSKWLLFYNSLCLVYSQMCTVAKAEKCVTKWSQRIFDETSNLKYRIFPQKMFAIIILFGSWKSRKLPH